MFHGETSFGLSNNKNFNKHFQCDSELKKKLRATHQNQHFKTLQKRYKGHK